jgi:hypothetical protein
MIIKPLSRRTLSLTVFSGIALVSAIGFEWIMGTACTTPQVIHEVQTAQSVTVGKTATTISGGLSWAPSGGHTWGVPCLANADFSLLIRHGYKEDKEVQVPINLSQRLGPGAENRLEEWLVTQLSTGVEWKRSVMIQSAISDMDSISNYPLFRRPLYNAYVWGPIIGATFSNTSYAYVTPLNSLPLHNQIHIGEDPVHGGDEHETSSHYGKTVFIFPYIGMYYKSIHERRKEKSIRMRGLITNFNFYYIDNEAVYIPVFSQVEMYLCGYVGGERKRAIIQFTYGLGWQYLYGPKLFLGTTFSGKPH